MGIASDFVLIVVAGLVGGIAARLLRLPLLVGYVAAGVAVGPNTAGPTVAAIHDIELLAEIGVALLLFSIGLEISFSDLKPVRNVAVFGGTLQILITAVTAGLAANHWLAMTGPESAWFGAIVAISSTMVVLKTLSAANLTATLASRVMIGILVLQDLAVIPLLVVLPQLGQPGLLAAVSTAIVKAVILLGLVVALGTRALPWILRHVLAWGSRELFLVAVVAIGVGIGYALHLAGLSFALGAFVAGIVLSESEFSHQALSDVAPLRDIFGLLFFVSVGMLFDPAFALQNAGPVLASVTLIFAAKALIVGGLTRAFGYVNMAPFIAGLGLAQMGEFSFVLARSGLASGILTKPAYDFILTCTILSMALSPLVSSLALPLGRWFRKTRPAVQTIELQRTGLADHTVIAGFGRTGQEVARRLAAAGLPTLIVESNHSLLAGIRALGYPAIWGDISRPELLHAAELSSARAFIVTAPDLHATQLAVASARHQAPNLLIVARAPNHGAAQHLLSLGADHVIVPELEGAATMARAILNPSS